MSESGTILFSVPADHVLIEFRLQISRGEGHRATLTLGFAGDAGRMFLRFAAPHPLEDTFLVTDDAVGITAFDSRSDQWEDKCVRLEWVTGEGRRVVIWAEGVVRIH